MPELFPLSMSQYTLIVGLISNSDIRNSRRVNTLTCCFEWEEGSVEHLTKIGNRILEQNDAFRLKPVYRFPWKWKQYIEPFKEAFFPVIYFEREEDYENWLNGQKDNAVRLLKDPLYDFRILVRPGNRHTLWIQMNHFLTDGYSIKLLAQQIRALDKHFREGAPLLLPKPGSYREYVEKEKAYRKSPQFREDRAYWKNVFRYRKDFSFPGGARSMHIECDAKTLSIEGRLYEDLKSFSKDHGVSISSTLMSSAAVTAHAVKDATCFTMATLSYGRHDGVTRRTMGCMMNSPVMMYCVDEEETFLDFARKNYEENLEMLRHIRYSNLDFTPLSYVLCTLHGMNYNHSWILFSNMDYESAFLEGEPKGRMFWSNTNVSQFYVAVFDIPKENRVKMELRYQNRRFRKEDMEKLLSAYRNILSVMVRNPDRPLKELMKVPKEGLR